MYISQYLPFPTAEKVLGFCCASARTNANSTTGKSIGSTRYPVPTCTGTQEEFRKFVVPVGLLFKTPGGLKENRIFRHGRTDPPFSAHFRVCLDQILNEDSSFGKVPPEYPNLFKTHGVFKIHEVGTPRCKLHNFPGKSGYICFPGSTSVVNGSYPRVPVIGQPRYA